MFGKLFLGLLLALSLTPIAAMAESSYVDIEHRLTPEQLHATGLDKLSPEQLELLNGLLREEAVQVVQTAKAQAQAEAKIEAKSESKPASGTDSDHGSYLGLDQKPIKSRLKGSVAGWEPGTVFELENGQLWKVLKGSMKLRKPMQDPEIVVVPGFAGRWFLQVDEDLPKARVYRLD